MSSTEPSRRGRKSFGRATLMAAAALLAFTPPVAKAATYTFDNVAGNGAGFAVNGGIVDWTSNVADKIWNTDVAATPVYGDATWLNKTTFAADTLVFNAGTNVGTINLKTAVANVGGWTDNLGVTLTAANSTSTISLLGTTAIFNVATGKNSSIGSIIQGQSSLKKTGLGVLSLTAANSFTGTFELLNGGAILGASNPLGTGDFIWHRNTTIATTSSDSSHTTVGTLFLDLSGGDATKVFNGTNKAASTPPSDNLPPDNYTGKSFAGQVIYSSAGNLTFNVGSVVMQNGEEYTVNTNGAYVPYGAPATAPERYPYMRIKVSDASGVLTLNGAISQQVHTAQRYDYWANSTGTYDYGILKDGPGKLVLAGARSYFGFTEVREGTLILRGSNLIPAAYTVFGGVTGVNGASAVLTIGDPDAIGATRILYASQGTVNFDIPSVQSSIVSLGYLRTHAGYNGGRIDLTNFDGRAITLQILKGDGAMGDAPTYGNINYGTTQPYVGQIIGSGGIRFAGKTLGGVPQDTLTLAAGHSFTGGVVAEGGKIVFTNNTSFGDPNSTLRLSGDVEINASLSSSQYGGASGRLTTIDDGCTMNLSLASSAGDIDFNARLRGGSTSALKMIGGGTFAMNGDFSLFAGKVDLRAGTITLGNDSSLGAGLFRVGDDSIPVPADQTLAIYSDNSFVAPNTSSLTVVGSSGKRTTLNFRGIGSFDIGHAGVSIEADSTFDVVSGSTLTLSGPLTGYKLLQKSGAGTLSLFVTAPSYSGLVDLLAGKLRVSSSNAIGTGDLIWHRNSSIYNDSIQAVTFNPGNLYLDLSGGNSSLPNNGANKGAIDLPPDITYAGKSYTGEITYSSASNLTINASRVVLQNGEEYVTNSNGTYVPYGAAAELLAASNYNPYIRINVANATSVLTINGDISQASHSLARYDYWTNVTALYDHGIVKKGPGRLVLNGKRSYFGFTEVDAGILELGGANQQSGSTRVIGGTLQVSSRFAFSDGTMNATGDLFMGGGVVKFSNDITSVIVDQVSGTSGVVNLTTDTNQPVSLQLGFATTTTYQLSSGVSITGLGGIEKQGSGTFNVGNGTFDFRGSVKISGGAWKLSAITNGGNSSGSGLGSSSSAASNLVFNGGSLVFDAAGAVGSTDRNFTLQTAADAGFGTGLLGSVNSIDVTATTNLVMSGSAAATSGALLKKGLGSLTLSGDSLNTGGLTVSEGTLVFGSDGSAGRGPLTIAASTTINGISGQTSTLKNTRLSILGSFIFTGSGAITIPGAVTVSSATATTITTNGVNALTFAGGLSSASGGFTKAGNGTLSLKAAADSSFNQAINLNAGVLQVSDGRALGTGALNIAGGTLDSVSLTTLSLLNSQIKVTTSAAFTGSSLTLQSVNLANTSTLNVGNDVTILGTFNGVNGVSFTKAGAGKLSLAQGLQLNSVTTPATQSVTTVAAGQLDLLGDALKDAFTPSPKVVVNDLATLGVGSLNAIPSGGVTLSAQANLRFVNGTEVVNVSSLNGSGGITLSNNLGKAVKLQIVQANNVAQSSAYTGVIQGPGSLLIGNSGLFSFTTDNYFTGGVEVGSGSTLSISADSQLGGIDLVTVGSKERNVLLSGGTLQARASSSLTIQRNRGIVLRGEGKFEVLTGASVNVQSVVADDGLSVGALTKTGAGLLYLAGPQDNTYTGSTTVTAGELRIDRDTSLGVGSGGRYSNVRLDGGTLSLGSPGLTVLNPARSVALTAPTGGISALAGSIFEIDASISGPGLLTINGVTGATGDVRLYGVNTFTGGVSINQGRLIINSKDSLGASSQTVNVTLNGGTLVSAPTASTTITLGDVYNLPVTATNSAIEVSLGTSLVVGGLLDRSGSATSSTVLRKTGQGTLVLKGNNSFGGIWSIDQGVLQVEDAGQIGVLGSASARITNNAQLSFSRSDDYDFKNVVSGTGVVAQIGGGTLRLLGLNTYTGNTLVSNGKLTIGNSSVATSVTNPKAAIDPSSTVSVAALATLELANVQSGTTADLFPNYITGFGDVHVRYYAGTVLSFGKAANANNYTGTTYVDSGTLKPVTFDAISRSAGFQVAAGATLDLTMLAASGATFTQSNDKYWGGAGTIKATAGANLVLKGTLSPGGNTPYDVGGIGELTVGQTGVLSNVVLQAPSSTAAQGFVYNLDVGSVLSDKLTVRGGNVAVAGKLYLQDNANRNNQGSAGSGSFVIVSTPDGVVTKGLNPYLDANQNPLTGFILDSSQLPGFRAWLEYATDGKSVILNLSKVLDRGAVGALTVSSNFDFGSVHVNDVARKAVPVQNTATGTNPDTLNISFLPPAPGLEATGSIIGLKTTDGVNSTALQLKLSTLTPGLKNSSVQMQVTSVSSVAGQDPFVFSPALLSATGKVYAYADPQVDATTLDIGSSHPNVAFVPKKIAILNNAPTGGYGESLQVQVGAGTSSNLNANGVILSLSAQATDSTSISAAFKAQGTAGLVNGSFTLDFVSINQPNSGLFPTALPSQTYNVVGRVYDYAVPDALSLPSSIALGSYHVNDVAMQAVTVRNTASSVSGYSESLSAAVTTTGSVRTSGTVDSLAPQASSDAIRVGVSTTTPGALSGKANIGYTSIAFANSGLQDTPLTSLGKSINVSATVYDYAHPVVPTTIDVGSVHVGEAFSFKAVNVQNQLQAYAAANPSYVEKLDVTFPNGTSSNVSTTGSVTGLAAGDSSGTSLMVTLNSATSVVGSTTGLLTLGFNSKAVGGSGLQDTALSTKNITITGKVYALAQVSMTGGATPVLNLGSVHSGDSISAGFLAVGNSATPSLYTETLKVTFDSITATNNLKLSGSIAGLQAGNTDSGTMQVGFLPGSVGSQVGSVNLLFTSQALAGSGIVGDTSLGQATLTVRGTVYDYAKAVVPVTTFTLPAVHVNGSFGMLPISVSNTASATANTEALNASLVSPTNGVLVANGSGGSITLAGQDTDNSTLSIGLDSALATTKGIKTGSANLRLVSKIVPGAVGLTDTVLANQVISISGAVYDYATHNLPATNTINLGPVRGGVTYAVPELAVTNTGSAGAYTEPLKVVFNNPSQEMVTTGSIAALAAGSQDTSTLKVGFVSGLIGPQSGSFNLRATSVGQAGLADTQLPSAAYAVTGTVYQVASASKLPSSVYLGAFHVGDAALKSLTIENTASSPTYGEGLTVDALAAANGAKARVYGNITNLAPGATNSSDIVVGVDTTTAGQVTGTVNLAMTSIPKVVPLQPLALANATVGVTADIYDYATPTVANITVPSIHVGDPAGFLDGNILVRNTTTGGLYAESLKATVLSTSSNLTARSSQVIATAGSSQALTVNLATPTQGGQSFGTVTLGYTSLAVHTGVLNDTPLAKQSVVEVRGNAYDYARGQVAMSSANLGNQLSLASDGHIVFNIGDTRVGGTYADAYIPLKNSGPAGLYTENLRASLTTTTPDLSVFSGTVDIAPGEVNASTLKVGFTPLKATNAQLGPTSGNIRINLTSLADAGSGLHNTTLDPINVEVVGNAYQAAAPVLNKPLVRLGRPVYGPYMAVMDTNARYDSTGWIYSNADPLMSEGLTLRNNTPAGTWSESLGWTATLTGAAKLTDNGTLAGTLAPSDTRVLNLGLTPQAGVVTGTVHFDYISKAAANSTLQDVAISVGSAADVTVRTVGYRAADWALPAATTVNRAMSDGSTQKIYRLNVGSVKTGQPFSTLDLIFSNTAPDTGGWTENLKVVVRNSTAKTVVGSAVPAGYTLAPITLAGGINALTWGRNSSAGDITATFVPGNSGNLVGYFGLDIYSSAIANPTGGYGSSLGDYLLDSIIVELYGSVMDKATASVASSIDFGATRVGVPFAWRGVEVSNTGTSVSAAAEMINATIDSVTLNGQARGTGVNNLPATPGSNINTTGIQANLDVSAAGNRSGVLTVNLSSTDGTTATTLDPQTVNLYGKVYAPADPYLATTVNLGSFRMGSTATKSITIGNQAVGGFAESLGVTVNSVSAGLSSPTMNLVTIAPGSTGVVNVGLGSSATEGAISGSVRLDMQSLGAYGLAPMQLASSTVAVSATVYKPADPSLVPLTGLVNGAVDFGYKHQGADWGTKAVYVQNLATGAAGFVESLGASLGSFTGDASSSSSSVTVAPGATSSALLLTLADKTAGQKSGTAKVLYTSLSAVGSGLNDLALTSQYDTITVTGYMYSGQGVWTGGSGNWTDDPLSILHWTKEGGRPGMDGQLSIDSRDSATFSNGPAATITVDTPTTVELTTLTFNSAAGTRIAKAASNVGFKLNGSVTSGRGLIDVKLGSNTIEVPISFDTTANDIKLADNTSLYLLGDLTSASAGSGLTVQGVGTGTLHASGHITVSNFTIDSGKVVFDGSDPLSADVSVVVNGGSLDLAGHGQTVANLTVKGGVVTASGASRATPSVIRAATFTKDSAGSAWLGDKTNREAIVIEGMSGVSQINTGKLYNNAWFKGELLVASGATLGGNGRSGAVYNYGTIAPGNSIDTYNAGSTVFYTGSTLSIEANQGAADLLNVTGSVTINTGANVQVIAYEAAPATPTSTTLVAGTRHTIVSSTGAITGQFTTVAFDAATAALLPPDLRPTLLYGTDGAGHNTIDLLIGTISGPTGGAIGGTPFADYLQRHNGLLPLNFPSLLALGSGTPALYNTLDHIDLTTLSSLPSALTRSGSRFTKVVESDVFAELSASGASFSGQGISKQNMLTAKDVLRAIDGVDTFTGTWTRGYSEVTSVSQSDGRFDYDYTLAGVAAGIDLRRTQEETVGVAFGFSQFESKFGFDNGRTKGDGVDLGFYALHHAGVDRLALGLSISRYSLTHQHNFTLAGLTKTATGETSAQRMQLNIEGDRQILAKDGWIYRGRALGDVEFSRRNGFTESGAGELGLAVDGQRTTGVKLGIGASAARTFARGDKNSGWTFVGELMAVQGWLSGDVNPTAHLVSDQTGDRYQVNAPSSKGLTLMPSLRLEYRSNNTGMTVELTDEIAHGASSPGVNLKFDTRF